MLRGASELRLTRIDLPFLLGTALTATGSGQGPGLHRPLRVRVRLRARLPRDLLGYRPQRLAPGGRARPAHGAFAGTALVNVLLPLVHPRMGNPMSAADTVARLEPPGFLMSNYGGRTPVVMLWPTSPTARSSAASSRSQDAGAPAARTAKRGESPDSAHAAPVTSSRSSLPGC